MLIIYYTIKEVFTVIRSLADSSSSGQTSIGLLGVWCEKWSLMIGISLGHWFGRGVPINLLE